MATLYLIPTTLGETALDRILPANNANIISISYNEDGDVLEVLYSTGNKTVFNYDEKC